MAVDGGITRSRAIQKDEKGDELVSRIFHGFYGLLATLWS
jgi:hypothetical protein